MNHPPYGGLSHQRIKTKSANITWSKGAIPSGLRAARNGHMGAVVWLTGLSGSGKSTIARELERELFNRCVQAYVLDGDIVRQGLSANLGFSREDRAENIRRVAEVARLMADAGLVVISAFISPYLADRQRAREIALEGHLDFFEIFIDASLAACEQRDPKDLYKKARAGEIKEFTGINTPYEIPDAPELILHTDRQTPGESVALLLDFLKLRLGVAPEVWAAPQLPHPACCDRTHP
ncbi:MAG: adenylyl-sulfate kinase [Verrucomicrobiota bacterium]